MAGAWHAPAAGATMRGWLVMTAGPRCSSTKTSWPAAAATSARATPTPWPPPATSPVSLRAAGEYQAARELGEDTLARRRRVLGEDHPDTGASATFAIFLRTPRPLLKTLGWVSRRRRAG
jgi:Tetratricopeptide repeat